jgi:hypothetical protein
MTNNYVPAPDPIEADRLIGVHYFPGWKPGTHRGWSVLADFPERKPLLGWYDESNPEVTDWEIKWALEHGISFFVYCWYRNQDNKGKPLAVKDARLGHAIHEGLFQSRYREQFRFAIMWENEATRAMIAGLDDLRDNLLPFWCEQYFSKPFYLRMNDRPVLFVYRQESLIEQTGGEDGATRALEIIRDEIARRGLGDVFIMVERRWADRKALETAKRCGFDASFAYCWHAKERSPTIEQAFDQQIEKMQELKELDTLPFVPTATVGWDPMPWANESPNSPWLHKEKMTRWFSSPDEFRALLTRVKEFADGFPEGDLARSMLLLDNWNEWGEGHFISPHARAGFGYLEAVRSVFTACDNTPDHGAPQELGLGPYGPENAEDCPEAPA